MTNSPWKHRREKNKKRDKPPSKKSHKNSRSQSKRNHQPGLTKTMIKKSKISLRKNKPIHLKKFPLRLQ